MINVRVRMRYFLYLGKQAPFPQIGFNGGGCCIKRLIYVNVTAAVWNLGSM